MVEHMQYIKNLAGIDAIALGSDFDGFGELDAVGQKPTASTVSGLFPLENSPMIP